MKPFSNGDRVKVSAKAKEKYGAISIHNGTVVGRGGMYGGIFVLHDDGWKNLWKGSSALEHVSPVEDLASVILNEVTDKETE